jgi:ABC-type molybdenum transport system ATPase subunit/photorepair protein PhrA
LFAPVHQFRQTLTSEDQLSAKCIGMLNLPIYKLPMLEVSVTSLQLGRRVLSGPIKIAVPSGEIHVLRGPNGCGKSLLFDAITGTYPDRSVVLSVIERFFAGSWLSRLPP